MKKTLLLLLLSISAFSQVFHLDTTFKFEPVTKQLRADYPVITSIIKDSLINILYRGNIYDNKPVASANLLVNKDGRLIRTLPQDNNSLTFTNMAMNAFITPDGKYITVGQIKNDYTVQKYNPDGTIDSSFRFPRYKEYINQLFLLHNGNIVVAFNDYERLTVFYTIINSTGEVVRTFRLTDYGFKDSARLNNIVFNDFGEHFFYVMTPDKEGQIFKTDKDLVRADTFPSLIINQQELASYKSKIAVYRNALYIYNVPHSEGKHNVEKFDRNGTRLWHLEFDRVSPNISAATQFYHQSDESLDLIFYDQKHLRIKPDGTLDPVFYKNPAQENLNFLHAFSDGSYWVMRKEDSFMEKMNADGTIDPDFKVNMLWNKRFYPNRIEKQGDNYLVELIDIPLTSPYVVRNSTTPSCIRVYNWKHEMIHEFFDSKTKWQVYKSSHALTVRGAGKFYSIESGKEMRVWADTLQQGDQPDLENQLVYRLLSVNLLARYKKGGERDTSFRINMFNGYRITGFQILQAKKEIMVQVADNTGYQFFIYNETGIQERPIGTLDFRGVPQYAASSFYTLPVENGYLIHSLLVGGVGNIYQSFSGIRKDYSYDTDYTVNLLYGGQFYRYTDDGSVYMSTVNLNPSPQSFRVFNFVRFLPNGKVDGNFAIKGLDEVYGFDFFDENTIYASGKESLYRFVKSKETAYFNYTPFSNKIVWNNVSTQKLNYTTNISPIRIEVSGNAVLANDTMITFMPKAGLVNITFKDQQGKILAHQQLELTKVVPVFDYTYPLLYSGSAPYEFRVASSSGLPVKVSAYGNESVGGIIIDPRLGNFVKVVLKSEGNDQYEPIEETVYLIIQSPLSGEPMLDDNLTSYPNPVSDILYIRTQNMLMDSFRLINTSGKEVPVKFDALGNKYRISLGNLPPGVYILLSNSKNRQFRHKIIIE